MAAHPFTGEGVSSSGRPIKSGQFLKQRHSLSVAARPVVARLFRAVKIKQDHLRSDGCRLMVL